MSDKLNLSLEELIKKEREGKKQSGGPKGGKFRNNRNNKQGFNKQQRMRQRLSTGNAPNAREKAKQLRRNKVKNFGGNRSSPPQQFNTQRPRDEVPREGRADRENWKRDDDREEKKSTLSTRLKVTNLSNTISNEDLNVLFKNIGPLKEWRREYDEFGRPLGSAIVAYNTVEDAKKAVEEYNKAELDDNVLVIEYVPNARSEGAAKGNGSRSTQIGKLKLVYQDGKKVIKKS